MEKMLIASVTAMLSRHVNSGRLQIGLKQYPPFYKHYITEGTKKLNWEEKCVALFSYKVMVKTFSFIPLTDGWPSFANDGCSNIFLQGGLR